MPWAKGRPRSRQWERVRRIVLKRDGYRCTECGRAGRLEVDHIIPHHLGGLPNPSNLRTLCRDCHIKRHRREATRTEVAWQLHLDGFDKAG